MKQSLLTVLIIGVVVIAAYKTGHLDFHAPGAKPSGTEVRCVGLMQAKNEFASTGKRAYWYAPVSAAVREKLPDGFIEWLDPAATVCSQPRGSCDLLLNISQVYSLSYTCSEPETTSQRPVRWIKFDVYLQDSGPYVPERSMDPETKKFVEEIQQGGNQK